MGGQKRLSFSNYPLPRSRALCTRTARPDILSVLNSVVSPYMLNPTKGNLKGKAAFPAAVFTILLLIWAFFRLPETKGMTTETLDHLFHQEVAARKFKDEAQQFQ
ncbi:hypothetical protein BJX64DRAFT_272795 [Aspergillus heterothallicus]